MTQDLKTELAEMVGPAEWRWLSPHADRDALLLVDQGLDLVEVGLAIAEDDLTRVSHWLSEALVTLDILLRIEPRHEQAWALRGLALNQYGRPDLALDSLQQSGDDPQKVLAELLMVSQHWKLLKMPPL